jgi:hypothetical protein
MEKKVTKKKPVRHVWGRLRNVEAGDKLFTFQLTKVGLTIRQRNRRKMYTLGFDRLVAVCEGVMVPVPGELDMRFILQPDGVSIQQGKRNPKLITFKQLINLGRDQMVLFPDLK